MKEPITRYVEDRYAKLNEFVSMQPDMSALPDFEKEKGKLPEPVWAGHDDEIAAYYKAWEIAFRNLGKPTKESGFVSPYIDAAFNGHIFMGFLLYAHVREIRRQRPLLSENARQFLLQAAQGRLHLPRDKRIRRR